MNVPFLDLKQQYAQIREEVHERLERVMEDAAFAAGPYVKEFEKSFATFCDARHAIGVGSGTAALWLALLALDVGPGDEVITVPNTFIATVAAIRFTGARPVLVDVDEETYTMDPRRLAEAITPRTRAIIPVHLFGQMADMDPIMDIARAHQLQVVEDAAQAHDAEYKGRRAGSIGDAGCFSFYPGKNLGAYGEAGAVTTKRDDVAEALRMLIDHGQSRKYYHDRLGWNGRMDGFQGAVLGVKLKYLPDWTNARRRHARAYDEGLADVDSIVTPVEAPYARHVYHLYAIRANDRDGLMTELKEQGVGCGIHYPIPVHLQKACSDLGYGVGSFPVAERCAREYLSLPMFPELTREQVDACIAAVRDTGRLREAA